MLALAAAVTALSGRFAGGPAALPRQAQLVIARTRCTHDAGWAGSACVLEEFSSEHVMASFRNSTNNGVISLFADWSAHEWQALKRFLPEDHAAATVVLTEEPEITVTALRRENRSCAVFPSSLHELQPLVRIFASFRGLAASYGLQA